MTDHKPRHGWDPSLIRYLVAVGLSLFLAFLAVLTYSMRHQGLWREDRSPPFQTAPEGEQWRDYSPELAEHLLQGKQIVLVHLVADWSRESQENRVLLSRDGHLRELFKNGKVIPLLANVKTDGGAMLAETHDLSGQPGVLLLRPGQDAEILTGRVDPARVLALVRPRS